MLDNVLDGIQVSCNILQQLYSGTLCVYLSCRGSCGRGTGSRGQDCSALLMQSAPVQRLCISASVPAMQHARPGHIWGGGEGRRGGRDENI